MSEIDVLAGNFTLIDWEIHELWIRGLSIPEAVTVLREQVIPDEYAGGTMDLLVSDLSDHFRLFAMLESMLLAAGKFSEQLLYQIDSETQHLLVEKYYHLDSILCREFLGKKLNSRLRKDLDELSEKTGIHLKSCRRQFDNIKRIYKAVEDMPGFFVPNIQKHFSLSRGLAEKYAAIIFLSSFRLEMSKKKLSFLSFEVIKTVSLKLMDDWMECDDDNEVNIDKEFLQSLKELKILMEKDKEHRSIVICQLQRESVVPRLSTKKVSDIETNFKPLTRGILGMAQSLGSSRELKDFFIHLLEKIVEPLKQMDLNKGEVATFLHVYGESLLDDKVAFVDGSVKVTLRKFIKTLSPCILAVY